MNDFEQTVLAKLGALEANTSRLITLDERMKHLSNRVDGHHQTLYGENGRGGLSEAVTLLCERQQWWNRGLGILSAMAAGLAAWVKWGGGR